MQNLQLFLNHQPADLGSDTLQLTFQINNLAEVQNQQGDFSKQFKLPLTQHNRRLLGFPDEVPLTDNTAYQLIPAKIVQDGLEIMPGGYATIEQVENDGISIIVRAGNSGFFTLLGDFKIWEMADKSSAYYKQSQVSLWKEHDHRWSIANVAASQQKTGGWIWPLVDYGQIDATDFTKDVNVKQLRPGFFLKDAIDIIVKSTGYKLDVARSPILQDPLYQKLIVQFANDAFEHSKDYETGGQDSLSGEALTNRSQGYGYGTDPVVRFHNIVKSGNGSMLQIGLYQAKANVEVDILVEYDVQYNSYREGGHFKVNIAKSMPDSTALDNLTTKIHSSSDFNKSGKLYSGVQYKQKVSFSDTVDKDRVIYITIDVDSKDTSGVILPGARLTVTEKKTNVLYGQMVQCEHIFPDISQKDLLKDTLQRFGLTCQTNTFNKTIALASFADIVNNIPRAYDWSAKCLNQGKNITMRLGSYAQVNNLKYKEDETLTTASDYNPVPLAKDYFNDTINVADKTLPPVLDLLESQFAPSLTRPFIGGYMAKIQKIDPNADEADYTLSTQPRLLVDYKVKLSDGKKVKLVDYETDITITDVISVPYFHRPDGAYTLSWKDMDGQPGLKTQYYAELEKILKQAKKVTRYFILSARDIADLDLLVPVYLKQDGCYYYISMVDNWVINQPCKVELVKLG